jgi:hypothetical protein
MPIKIGRAGQESSPLKHLRQVRTYQVAAVMYPRIPPGTVGVQHLAPFHQVALAAVPLDQPVNVIAALAVALGAFDAGLLEFYQTVTIV